MKLDRKQDLNVLYQVCVFRANQKTRWLPWPLIGWDFDFSSETDERNSTKLDRKQDINVLHQVFVIWADRKKQDGHPGLWLAETFLSLAFAKAWGHQISFVCPSLCLSVRHKNFNLGHNFCTITDRALILGMCVLCDKTLPMVECRDLDRDLWPTSRSNLLPSGGPQFSEFACWLLLWNRWTEFNETWQEARSQCPLQSLCFSGWSVIKNVRLGRLLKQVHDMWPFGPLVVAGDYMSLLGQVSIHSEVILFTNFWEFVILEHFHAIFMDFRAIVLKACWLSKSS